MRQGHLGATGSGSLDRVRPAGRALAWGLVYWLAGQVGLRTSLPDKPLSLVAPAAGILIVWFAFSTRRSLPWDLAALTVFGMSISHQLGLPVGLVLFGVLISLSQVGVFLVVMRAGAGDLAPFGGNRISWRLPDLGVYLLAAVAAALTTAVLATVSQSVAGLPTGDLPTFFTRWGRISATIVAVSSVGLLLGPELRDAWHAGRLRGWLRDRVTTTPARRAEGVAVIVVGVALDVVCFWLLEDLPLTFVLFVVTAWVGIRYSPAVAATYSLLGGAVGVVATLQGHGIFAVAIQDAAQRAVVAQLFVLVTSATALTLAVARSQMLAAEQLAESRMQMLDQVLFEVDDGVMLIQEDGTVLMVNRAGKALFDIDQDLEHALPAAAFELYEADGSRVVEERAPFRRALRGEVVAGEELELRRGDGTVKRHLRLSAAVLPTLGPGHPRRVLVSYQDVTGARLRQEALAAFAGHVAHDLRNPLSVVEAWNELLTDAVSAGGEITPQVVLPMTTKIGAASARMRDFIQGLLSYTLARDRPIRPEQVDLVAVAADVAELRSGPTGDGEAPVVRVIGAGTVVADREMVRIVLDNLVANAIKYVAPGVRPRVLVLIEEVEPASVACCVIDNGIGIPADQRGQVFESFHRVEQGGRFEGTGLGLGICQRIVERHGGAIVVEDVSEGTSIRVVLPRAARPMSVPLELVTT